jgi:hypothetical protein
MLGGVGMLTPKIINRNGEGFEVDKSHFPQWLKLLLTTVLCKIDVDDIKYQIQCCIFGLKDYLLERR